jgi:hypothetical protein
MDNILKYGLLGVAAPVIDKLTDTSANDARMAALEKNNEDYKKQLDAMQQTNAGQTKMKKGGKVGKCPYDGIAEKGKTRAKFK